MFVGIGKSYSQQEVFDLVEVVHYPDPVEILTIEKAHEQEGLLDYEFEKLIDLGYTHVIFGETEVFAARKEEGNYDEVLFHN